MIHINELRLGNLLQKDSLHVTVNWTHLKEIEENPLKFNSIYSGIKLSAEFLKAYGFTETDLDDPGKIFTAGHFKFYELQLFRNGICNVIKQTYVSRFRLITSIDSFHQLQNIYFDLMHQELLKIK